MSAELRADDQIHPHSDMPPTAEARNGRRPNVAGDLPTVFQAAPMFRRTVGGYDRFQVDTYVQWAEDELATADREREDLVARHLSTRAALDEARRLLAHSPGGGEFLKLSTRLGSMLAAAADEADGMRAEAAADRSAASAEAAELVADAARTRAAAEVETARMVAEAATRVAHMVAQAERIVDAAGLTACEARAEADARLAEVQLVEQRALEQAEQLRRRSLADAAVARLQTRHDAVQLLGTGREQRRRADDEAAAVRERLDRQAAARRSTLLAEVAALERRRAALRAEVVQLAARVAVPTRGRRDVLRSLRGRIHWHPRTLRTR